MSDYTIADTLHIAFSTRAFATGIPTVLAGTPVVSAYEDAGLVQITAGITLGVSHDGVVGLNMLTIVATGANGYESGKDYNLVISTGTVGGVSVVGEVVGRFTLGRSAAAVDLANGTDGLGTIKTDTAAILVDTGTTLDTKINDIQGATFSSATDSLEAIRDRGDAAWTTGAGGSDRLLLVDTTIATLATQTSFTLTAGSADNDAYNNCSIVVEDVATATQKAVGMVLDYVGATKTVTLKEALAFTIATTDKVYILAENSLKSTVANRQLDVTVTGAAGIDWGNVENPTTAVDLSATDIQLADTVTTLTGHTAQTGDSFTRLGAPAGANVSADIAVIEGQTDDIGVAGVGLTAINLPNQTMDIVGNITGNLSGSVGSVTGSVGSVVGHTNQTGDNFVRLGAPAGANVSADIAAVKVDTDKIPEGVDKNTALSNFEFVMYDSTDHITPKTGLTVTGTRSIDGGAFGAVSGTFAEIGNGVYQFDALAADTNGDLITWRFAAATADDTFFTFKTS